MTARRCACGVRPQFARFASTLGSDPKVDVRAGRRGQTPIRLDSDVMKAPLLLTLAGLAAAVAFSAQGNSTPSSTLLVLSKGDLTLATVDPTTLKVLGRVPSGPDPHEVIASTDGRMAYISNYGGGSFTTITPVDLVAQKALEPIQLGALRGPHGLVFVGGKLWFTAEGSKVIGRYDPATRSRSIWCSARDRTGRT